MMLLQRTQLGEWVERSTATPSRMEMSSSIVVQRSFPVSDLRLATVDLLVEEAVVGALGAGDGAEHMIATEVLLPQGMTADGIEGSFEMIGITTRTGSKVYDTMEMGFGIWRRQEGVQILV